MVVALLQLTPTTQMVHPLEQLLLLCMQELEQMIGQSDPLVVLVGL